MKQLNRKTANVTHNYPERILQFGGGNFLRGFVDWIIDKYNRQSNDDKLGIVVVKVRKGGTYQPWKEQDGLYHLFTKGFTQGNTINKNTLITSVGRILEAHQNWDVFIVSAHQPSLNIIVSNTTETGLAFSSSDQADAVPSTFPGQLTKWLHERYLFFKGDKKAGCTIIPCELLDNNGQVLKASLLRYADHWGLHPDFSTWIEKYCHFCNTLVDRIVPGIDKKHIGTYQDRIGFEDKLMTEGEPYHLWAIETKHDLGAKLPLNRIGLNVVYTNDLFSFRELKLKILNGAHTSMVPVGLLLGVDLVKNAINHDLLAPFIEQLIFEEIVPVLDVNADDARVFAGDVLDRFKNPFLDHYLKTISLYSVSKFNARLKPTVKAFVTNNGIPPKRITLAFSCLLVYYSGNYKDLSFSPDDRPEVLEKLQNHWNVIRKEGLISSASISGLLGDKELWEEDLNQIKGFAEAVSANLTSVLEGNLEALMA